MDDVLVAREMAADGVIVRPLSRYYIGKPARQGLLLGFGCVREESMGRPFHRLVRYLTDTGPGLTPRTS
jgi:GntR family transcriptional regulator/MocR family aminotransferase